MNLSMDLDLVVLNEYGEEPIHLFQMPRTWTIYLQGMGFEHRRASHGNKGLPLAIESY